MSNTQLSTLKLETRIPNLSLSVGGGSSQGGVTSTGLNRDSAPRTRRRIQGLVSNGSGKIVNLQTLAESFLQENSEKSGKTETNVTSVEIIERGSQGRYVYVPHDLRVFIFTHLDVDNLFHTRSFDADESSPHCDPTTRRIIRNTFSVPLYEMMGRAEEIKESFEKQGAGSLGDDRVQEMKNLLALLASESEKFNARFAAGVPATVTAEELTILLSSPDRLFTFTQGETKFGFISRKAEIKRSIFGNTIEISGYMYINSGKAINRRPYQFSIPMFAGEKSMDEIGVNLPTVEETAALVERGKKYAAIISNPTYCQYVGDVVRKSWMGSRHYKSTGRVMVDMMGMRNMDPNYGYYFGFSRYDNDSDDTTVGEIEFTNDMYAVMPPVVYGFSFVSKVWGEILLENISDIVFRENAYDMLVMEKERKDMVFALVNNSVGGAKDFIDGKGGGCVFLLAGPPGGGKTLTAEAVSEALGRPLYMVGVGELGTDVTALEDSLRKILDVATTWNAVLLIDECDIFMEARNQMDVERNAMVGVFLRLLEYYEGVLFLTTNRAENIDQAFYSRISMALYYEPLNANDRKTVWGNLLKVYGIDMTSLDLGALASHDLNGRKIKGVIRIASALASSENRAPVMDDFTNVIDRENEFQSKVYKK